MITRNARPVIAAEDSNNLGEIIRSAIEIVCQEIYFPVSRSICSLVSTGLHKVRIQFLRGTCRRRYARFNGLDIETISGVRRTAGNLEGNGTF